MRSASSTLCLQNPHIYSVLFRDENISTCVWKYPLGEIDTGFLPHPLIVLP